MPSSCSDSTLLRRLLAGGLIFAFLTTPAFALSWSDRERLSPIRANFGSGVIGNKVYIAGGGLLGGFALWSYRTAQVYDPTTDRWGPIRSMDLERTWPGSTVADIEVSPGVFEPRLFLIGGADVRDFPFSFSQPSIEVYDPGTDSWSLFPSDVPSRYTASIRAATVDNLIYAFGGFDADSFAMTDGAWIIDPVAATITATTPSPDFIADGAIATVGRNIYYFGGWQGGSGDYGVPAFGVLIYNVDTASWSTGANLPRANANAAAVAVDTTIYLIGGWNGADAGYNHVLAYNTVADTWTEDSRINCSPDLGVPVLTGRAGASAHIARIGTDDYIYVAGGSNGNVQELSCHEYTRVEASLPTDTTPPDFAGLAAVAECFNDPLLELTLSWPPATDASPPVTYFVHRSPTPGFAPDITNIVAGGITGTTWTDIRTALDCGRSWSYVVRALDSAVPPNQESNLVEVTIVPTCTSTTTPPDNIGNRLFVTDPAGNPLLDWTTYPGVATADHYHLYRTPTKATIPGPLLTEPTPLTHTDATATGDLEFYEIRAAVDGCGDVESRY